MICPLRSRDSDIACIVERCEWWVWMNRNTNTGNCAIVRIVNILSLLKENLNAKP